MKKLPKIKLNKKIVNSLDESELSQFKGGTYACTTCNSGDHCLSCSHCVCNPFDPDPYATCSNVAECHTLGVCGGPTCYNC